MTGDWYEVREWTRVNCGKDSEGRQLWVRAYTGMSGRIVWDISREHDGDIDGGDAATIEDATRDTDAALARWAK